MIGLVSQYASAANLLLMDAGDVISRSYEDPPSAYGLMASRL